MKRKIISTLFALVLAFTLGLVTAVPASAAGTPTIDGTVSSGEWDAHYLGTSVTGWSGGMSVDVYGFADDTYLYAAYVADIAQPGWNVGASLCVECNFNYWTPSTTEWPDPGYTLLAAGGYPADVSQTDGSGWVSLPGSFADNGIDIYSGDGCYNTAPNPNVAEVKIPLSLLTYAGDNHFVGLGGQYWQYDFAEPLLVMLPPSPTTVYVDDGWAGLNLGEAVAEHTFGYDAFAVIQPAIDAVASSGTVNVAAGTYDSSVEAFPITIGKSLTLLGAQVNMDPRLSQGGRPGNESIIDADETSAAVIQISASDVEINGFTITGGKGDMVEESGSANNLLFRYNILYDDLETCNCELAWDSPDRGDEGIQIKNSDGVVMEYNYAYNICEDAFNLSDSTDGAIRYNEAHDIYSENAAIYCYGSTGLEIRGNLIYDVPNNDGIKLGDKDGSDAGTDSNSVIAQNIVHDTAQDGISVYTSGVTVEGNEIYNCGSENGAIYLAFEITDITIQNNRVHDNELNPSVKPHVGGIGIESPVDAANVHINNNNIYNNTPYGVNSNASDVVDATNNWWGDATPDFGTIVSGKVAYSPWLGDIIETSPMAFIVDDVGPEPADGYIQAAIDAASSGDTINVLAGIYNENVTIPAGKDHLKLIGAGSDTTTIAIPSGIAVRTNAPITVEGFHIQGPGRGTGTAIKVENATASGTAENPGVFKNNKVTGVNYGLQSGDWNVVYWEFVGNDFSDLRIGVGLENLSYVKVIVNSFKDYKEGVSMGWDPDTAHHVEIRDNEFLGDFIEKTDNLAAIVISSAAIDITVTGNEITNSVVGVLIKVKDEASNAGHEDGLDTVHINNNNIYGNDMGVVSEAFIETISVDATNNWWDDVSGPTHASNPSGTGDPVTDNVDFSPWLGATIETTPMTFVELVTSTDPDPVTLVDDEGDTIATVDISGGDASSGTIAAYSEPDDPEPGETSLVVGTGKTGVLFLDVKVSGYTSGTANITVPYLDTDNDSIVDGTGIVEDTLGLYYWDEAASMWRIATNSEVDTDANIVSGDIPVSALGGTPIGMGGYPEGEATVAIVSITNLSYSGNDIVALTITTKDAELGAVTIDLTFDNTVVEVLGGENSEFDSLIVNPSYGSQTTARFVANQLGVTGVNATGGAVLAQVRLMGVGTTGSSSPLTLVVITLKDNDGIAIPYTITPGATAAIGGLGDANSDGVVDVYDCVSIARFIAGIPVVGANEAAMDVDGKDGVDAFDCTYLARHIAGIAGHELGG